MQLATIRNGTPDGQLVLVSRDHLRFIAATGVAKTMQDALERWTAVEPQLREMAATLEADAASGSACNAATMAAPLPRAWQWLDGSAFQAHGDLMQKVFKAEPARRDRPLMYQGMSDHFYGPTDDIPFPSEADGIDFEGEFGVIVDAVPMGVSAEDAAGHIKLVIQINDWSLRAVAPIEMKTGFGWVQAKPACSMAPVAVTPDALGAAWRDGRVNLPLVVHRGDAKFGAARGDAMGFSFPQLIAHAACTRKLVAGTIIGSGTVSNENFREVGSSCIAERRGIELLDGGAPDTPYLHFGERVRMEARAADGGPLFGAMDQRVVAA